MLAQVCPALDVAYTQWNLAKPGQAEVHAEWRNLDGNVADGSTFLVQPTQVNICGEHIRQGHMLQPLRVTNISVPV